MAVESPVLDEAFDRMAPLDFELPNGFVNHGPMACEALAVLGHDEQIDGWARWFTEMVGVGVSAKAPAGGARFDWEDALGDYRRLPEWLGYFDRVVADDGWSATVALWVPRLMPGLVTALFHGAIRTAHGVRAVAAHDTAVRRTELARALAYWAARQHRGQPLPEEQPDGQAAASAAPGDFVAREVVAAAANGARHYVDSPSIFNLHGVTGAMAVALLVDHVDAEDARTALWQLRAEHVALYGPNGKAVATLPTDWDDEAVARAAASADSHQVKLVEACRRGFAASGDAAFASAARRVTAGR
jgi:hypothetical protein